MSQQDFGFPGFELRPGPGAAPPLPIPPGGYAVIAADPPWPYADQGGRMRLPYRAMDEGDLERFAAEIARAAAPNAHLWLWAVDAHLELALRMIRLAGFRFTVSVPWIKTAGADPARWLADDQLLEGPAPRLRIGGGHYLRHAHELALFAVRGSAVPDRRDVPSVLFAPRRRHLDGSEHSRKPDELLDLAELIAPPGPRIELFARRARPGWAAWGNEASLAARANEGDDADPTE